MMSVMAKIRVSLVGEEECAFTATTVHMAAIEGRCYSKNPIRNASSGCQMIQLFLLIPKSTIQFPDHGRVLAIMRTRRITSIQHHRPDREPHLHVPLPFQYWQLRSIRRSHRGCTHRPHFRTYRLSQHISPRHPPAARRGELHEGIHPDR